jgi:SAM-dependent methyltransferase
MKNNWWEISITKLISILNGDENERLEKAFDIKYGHYNYLTDLRCLCKNAFQNQIEKLLNNYPLGSKILVIGSNSGYEIKYLGGYLITALDLSSTALANLKEKFPFVKVVQGNMNKLPFSNNSFDICINLRSIQSHGVNEKEAVAEAVRVLKSKGSILLSIPNGYLDESNIIKGMWDSDKFDMNKERPYNIIQRLEKELKSLNINNINSKEILSEIFINGIKS